MAGRGPAPKTDSRRARRNSRPDLTVIEITPTTAPSLPDTMAWCDETLAWWQSWVDSELADTFTATMWSYLMDTAILHHLLWSTGDTSVLPELRIREANFAATPADAARLRIQFATAANLEQNTNRRVERQSARDRRGALTAVEGTAETG